MNTPPAPKTETQAIHGITKGDLTAWLAEHGLDIHDVLTAVVRLDHRGTGGHIEDTNHVRLSHCSHAAWLDVTWLKRDTAGKLYIDETGDHAARGASSIPLRSWPPLTPG